MLDMLTADAAAKHGHEYSPSRASLAPTSPNGSFFSQMPLSFLGSVLRKQTASPAPTTSSVDDVNTSTPTPSSPNGPIPRNNLMSADPATAATSPSPSRPASSSSLASAEDRPKKKAPRPKTTYNLAQPPPTAGRQKLHIRPKILLQLHQVIPSRRPKPVYEVIPFTLLAPRSTRRLARTFNTKDRLGPNDLLIVKAEEYGHRDEDKSDDERWGARDVIGIICPAKRRDSDKGSCSKTEVLLEDGSSWEVTQLPNGGYEFNFVDDHGLPLKRRWVPKTVHNRRVSTMSNGSQTPANNSEDKRFNFSTISNNSRRHPVIATMSRTSIDVSDSYAMPTATSPPTPGYPPSGLTTPIATPSSITDAMSFMDFKEERLPIQTDDALRKFILVSGIWVAFAENWSLAYAMSRSSFCAPLATSLPARPSGPNRTVSMSVIDSPRSASPASTIDENRKTLPRLFRTGTQKLQNSASFSVSTSSPISSTSSPTSSPQIRTRGRRSNSTGDTDFNPYTGSTRSTRRRFGLEDQKIPETEEERQSKRSMEILRIKELALPDSSSSTSPPIVPIKIIEPTSDSSLPPISPDTRERKVQSAYNPIITAGLWDSGVTDGPGLKSRPTSLVVVNEKKEKAKKKQERVKHVKEKGVDCRRKSDRFKHRLISIFRKEKE